MNALMQNDPYAAIRRLSFVKGDEIMNQISEDELAGYYLPDNGVSGGAGTYDWDRAARDGLVRQAYGIGSGDNASFADGLFRKTGRYNFSMPDEILSGSLIPYRSKYGSVYDLGNGRVQATFQQPGAHKYDTMDAVYALDPTTGQYVLESDPWNTRQTSTRDLNMDALEKLAAAAAVMGGAYYGGTQLAAGGGSGAAATAAGLDTANAAAALGGAAGSGAGGLTAAEAAGVLSGAGSTPFVTAGEYGLGSLGSGGLTSMGLPAGGTTSLIPGISNGQLLNAGLSLGQALIGNDSTKRAINAQQAATTEANALARETRDLQLARLKPYDDAATGALGQIQALLKDPSSITKAPDFQFGLDQGRRALENSASARGMTISGAQQQALTKFGNDYANSQLDRSYNRLANIAGLGQVGAGNNALGQYGQTVGNNLTGMGNARAGAYVNQGANWGNALGQIGGYKMFEDWSNRFPG